MDQADRRTIGIIFNFKRNWLGGVYYILNIIKSLNFLDDQEKPRILVFYTEELADFAREIKYPYLQLIPWQFPGVYKGYLTSWLTGKNAFVDGLLQQYSLDGLYPLNDHPIPDRRAFRNGPIVAAWFPDLQHKFYPAFFDRKRLWLREARIQLIVRNSEHLVVSSHDVADHFRRFYSLNKHLHLRVLQFVSIMDEPACDDPAHLRATYQLTGDYFMVSNQFHKHKNHLLVWQAVQRLKAQGREVQVAVSGKMENPGNDDYLHTLRSFIAEHQLENNIRLLGVIPRRDQLCLMKHAKAVIQPSLFEGWSTVIEDAKSLQTPVIASDLPVHREQLGDNGKYFHPHQAEELADLLASFQPGDGDAHAPYALRAADFARNFISLFDPPNRRP